MLDDPWSQRSGWRLNLPLSRRITFSVARRQDRTGRRVCAARLCRRLARWHGHLPQRTCRSRRQRLTGLAGHRSVAVSAVFAGEVLHLFGADGHITLHYARPWRMSAKAARKAGGLRRRCPAR
jgi:hypothetical protein